MDPYALMIVLVLETVQVHSAPFSLPIRLAGGTESSNGRIEVLHKGTWGTVCDDAWDDKDATVVCQMFGYNSGTAQGNGIFGHGTGQIWLDGVNCLGNETSLSQCDANAWGEHDCRHSEDAGVVCSNIVPIRLVGDENANEGRVEIYHKGIWGTICDDHWDDSDSTVICSMFGYSSGKAKGNGFYGRGTGKIWLDEVNCSGNETTIEQCEKNVWGQHDCSHGEDAGVLCTNYPSIRLAGGNHSSYGRVEILHLGTWGTVCDDDWDDRDATVVCKMLGYSYGTAHGSGIHGIGTGMIWLDEVNCFGNETTIGACKKDTWGKHDCEHNEDASVACSNYQSMRLVGGSFSSDGRVEILHKGTWGTICDDQWDDRDANVVCNMLGYSSGIAEKNGSYGYGNGQIWLDEINCSGNETSLDQCEKNAWGQHDCSHSEDAGVHCMNSPSIRLIGGNSSSEGRVEISHQGIWGTICDDSWGDNDAQVICYMLGYRYGMAHLNGSYGYGRGQIWLDEVDCAFNETSIGQCRSGGWGIHDCSHGEDAGVSCTNTLLSKLPIRLVGSDHNNEGRVEILHEDTWGTVCDDHWDDRDAKVICNMLGYRFGRAKSDGAYGPGSGRIWLDEVGCKGTEVSIHQCITQDWGDEDCVHSEDAGVVCSGLLELAFIRLVGGRHINVGRLEILHQGIWGTICDDGWDDNDAKVVCNMLGYSNGVAIGDGILGRGNGTIWLNNVDCAGNETSIDQCEMNIWGEHDCGHSEDAGVVCHPYPVRLVGANSSHEGRVEIFYEHAWGTICNDHWDDNDAKVVCNMFGFSRGRALQSGDYGPGTGRIWLDDVRCNGDEGSIDQCRRRPWGRHNCYHKEDAGVSCIA